MKRYHLGKNWRIRQAGAGEAYSADIPATVADTLYRNGAIPDPYYRENEGAAYAALEQDYIFTNAFEVSEEMLRAHRLLLRFEGLDTVAEIFLNDSSLASVENMHRTYEFDIRDRVRIGSNEISIHFCSAIRHAEGLHAQDPYYATSDTVDGFSMVRKAHATYGWDWGPKLPDMGIWRDVSILAVETARLADVYIRQRHENGKVSLLFEVEVERYGPDAPVDLEIQITAPDGTAVTSRHPGIGPECKLPVEIENPMLWWCNGFGAQHLYRVRLALIRDGRELEARELSVGLRTLTIRREEDQWGESFEFFLNGISIFAMGANYIPEDSLYPRCSRERTEALIRQCVAANYNCIRVWGGGYFCEDYFYDLCDEYGLIVWQDLMFACGVYRLKEGFVENVVAETRDNIRRLRHHASIGLWCGNNELEWGWADWDMGFGNDPRDRADYIKLFEWVLPQTVQELDPDRFYWLASPSSGGSFDDPNDQNRGDVHYWEVWHRLKPFTEYRSYHFRFCSEFGFQSFPCEKTVDSFALPQDKNIFSPVMEHHQKNGSANGRILFYLSDNFLYPTSFQALLYASQILQAEAIKYGVEHWRSNRGRCMGSLYWQLNDCWPVASWASIDYFGRWKPLHYYAKRFYAPVLLAALEEGGAVRFVVSNETMAPAECRVVWRLRRNTGEILEEKQARVQAAPLAALEVAAADYSSYADERSCYLEYSLEIGGREISSSALLFVRPKHFAFPDPKVKFAVTEQEDRFLLRFSTESFAKYLTLDSPEFDFVASDNCFDLSKGQEKEIIVLKQDLSREVTQEDWKTLSLLSAYDIR